MNPQTIDLIGKIVLLIAYAIGTLIVIKNLIERNETLKNEIGSLRSQISTQSTLINDMKAVADAFRAPIELHDKIVEMHKEKNDLDKEKAIRELKEKYNRGAVMAINEIQELYRLSLTLVYHFGQDPIVEENLAKMSNDTVTKATLIDEMAKSKAFHAEIMAALLKWPEERLKELASSINTKE